VSGVIARLALSTASVARRTSARAGCGPCSRSTSDRIPRPGDPIRLGKLIGDIATGRVTDAGADGKDEAAVALARKGGAARSASMTPQRRAEIAKKGAAKRCGDN